jgi:hypothetical protein
MMIQEKITPCKTHVDHIDTKSSLNYSGSRTPQRNGKVEQKFQNFLGGIRVTFNHGVLEDSVRVGVCAECARITIFLSNIISIEAKNNCPYQLMFDCKPKLPQA